MALLNIDNIKKLGQQEIESVWIKTASKILTEENNETNSQDKFQIFLSHAYMDSDIILGLKRKFEQFDYSVYVDWVEDKHLRSEKTTKETAITLKRRMKNCESLLFAVTDNYSSSKWMPWECGYFDGIKDRVAICPVLKDEEKYAFAGQEYLGMYPYLSEDEDKLWIHTSILEYVSFDRWLLGFNPKKRNV